MSIYVKAVAPTQPQRFLEKPKQGVLLTGISWETYARLVAEHDEKSSTHFAYNRGALEIMVLSPKHEAIKHTLALLVDVLAEELEIDTYGFGSTTFQREDLARGFEPDACFYIQHEAIVRGKEQIDLSTDPPPDLVIEIDVTHPSLDKLPIYSGLGIAEVWRYANNQVIILTLEGAEYQEQQVSNALPTVTAVALTEFVESSHHIKRTAWLRKVRGWIRTL